jgi:hypothetical protein
VLCIVVFLKVEGEEFKFNGSDQGENSNDVYTHKIVNLYLYEYTMIKIRLSLF